MTGSKSLPPIYLARNPPPSDGWSLVPSARRRTETKKKNAAWATPFSAAAAARCSATARLLGFASRALKRSFLLVHTCVCVTQAGRQSAIAQPARPHASC